jgi:glutamate 5-kinase
MTSRQLDTLLVVKVGTNVLADTSRGRERLNNQAFDSIGREVRELSDDGNGVILVTSGAITAGVFAGKQRREDIASTVEEQRFAARGWDIVVQKWKSAIGAWRVSAALLTKHELRTSPIRVKLLGVIACCLDHGDIFVVNENDCLSDDEIKFGDNDTLAAALAAECADAGMARHVKLVLLTNKHGLNRVADDDSTLIRRVADIGLVEQYAGDATSGHGRGGMITKVRAAKVAGAAGVETYIASGREKDAVRRALAKKTGTFFPAR